MQWTLVIKQQSFFCSQPIIKIKLILLAYEWIALIFSFFGTHFKYLACFGVEVQKAQQRFRPLVWPGVCLLW